jgi:hypothetical protein
VRGPQERRGAVLGSEVDVDRAREQRLTRV